jgi:hypothetical protein
LIEGLIFNNLGNVNVNNGYLYIGRTYGGSFYHGGNYRVSNGASISALSFKGDTILTTEQ